MSRRAGQTGAKVFRRQKHGLSVWLPCQPLALTVAWFPLMPGSVVTALVAMLNSIHEHQQATGASTLLTALLSANIISH